MYGKVFASMFEGSMVGSGPDVFAVWTFALARAQKGVVELNPVLLSALIGMPVDRVRVAIAFLEQPDPQSRNPAEQGRRIIRDGQFQYVVVSHEKYRAITNGDEQREYNRNAQTRSRKNRKARESTTVNDESMTVNDCQPRSASASASAYPGGKFNRNTDDTDWIPAIPTNGVNND